jgi:hypothetical protein
MKFVKLTSFSILITVCVLGTLIVPNARADEWDKKTTLTFNQPVQVPGMERRRDEVDHHHSDGCRLSRKYTG